MDCTLVCPARSVTTERAMMRRSTRADREGLARNMIPTSIYAEFSEFADPTDRRDVTVHRIQAFEGDQVRSAGCCTQQRFQMVNVVMAPDLSFNPGLSDSLNH
jgi:hypothetical protein